MASSDASMDMPFFVMWDGSAERKIILRLTCKQYMLDT